MDDETDLLIAAELDASFGAGPGPLPTPAERVALGRRVVRRRRRWGAVVSAVAVVAAVGVGAVTLGGTGERATEPPATRPGPSSASASSASAQPGERAGDLARLTRMARAHAHRLAQRQVSDEFPATYDGDGQVVLKDGWRVVQRVEDPAALTAPEDSLGLVVTDDRATRWLLLMRQRSTDETGQPLDGELGTSVSADPPGKSFARFEDWLADQVAINGGPAPDALITVDAADVVQPGPGAEVLAVSPMPVVEGYSDAGDRVAEVRRDGRTWFVVIRGHGAEADTIAVDEAVLSAPTLEALVDHVREQAASGEGLR